jgi:beta-1,2-mannobiose phosphorylase / 1,2-beta-oligomannan phosphorylase
MSFPELTRFPENPLISPESLRPSSPLLQVEGVFNPAALRVDGETLLYCRVAESASPKSRGRSAVPIIGASGDLEILNLDSSKYDLSDPRLLLSAEGRVMYLSSLSHIRSARSRDGRRFEVDDAPCLSGRPGDEEWGVEDPRAVSIEGKRYMSYSAVSRNGVGVAIASSDGVSRFERMGMVLPPTNKDAALFPEKIGGQYWMLHRPCPDGIGAPDIWIADSPDLVHWGAHSRLLGAAEGAAWEARKVGAGAPPIRTEAGWLLLYHGVDARERYSVGVALLDAEAPTRILARSPEPLLEAEADYERRGFFGGAVFPCGAFLEGGDIVMYYGAADRSVCGASIPLAAVLKRLGR